MYMKDPNSKIVINTDEAHYKAILASRSAFAKTAAMNQEMVMLKEELSEIRNLLHKVIAK